VPAPAFGGNMTEILSGSGINKTFGSFQVLKDVNFTLTEGEALGIVGPNGAGKTTLFSVVVGSLVPSSGTVMFSGVDVTRADAARRCRAGIGRTHQVPRPLLGMAVFEDVLVAAQHGSGRVGEEAGNLAAEALERSDLLPLANRPAATLGLLDRKRLGNQKLDRQRSFGGLHDLEIRYLEFIDDVHSQQRLVLDDKDCDAISGHDDVVPHLLPFAAETNAACASYHAVLQAVETQRIRTENRLLDVIDSHAP
jgi:ABC-type uncharacterized transport system YnjBCD ATPase subunit